MTHAGICRACDIRAEITTTVGYDPFMEATLVVSDSACFHDIADRPLLYVAEGKAVQVIFRRQTDRVFFALWNDFLVSECNAMSKVFRFS